MFNKTHLWINNNYTAIRHWLLVALGITLLIFSMVVIAGQNRLIDQVKVLSEQNKQLAQDNKLLNKDTKVLSEQNQSIAKQNRAFTLCGFQVFAKYTREGTPIENLDLETCTTDSQTVATNDTQTGGTPVTGTSNNTSSGNSDVSQGSQSSQESVSSSQNTTTPPIAQPNNPQPALNCTVDVLFIHIGC